MGFVNNIRHALGLSNIYNSKFSFFIQNLILSYILLFIYSLNSSRLLNTPENIELFNILNTNMSTFQIFSAYFLFLFATFITFIILLIIFSLFLAIISKFFGSNTDIKLSFKVIYPYIFYFPIFLFSFVLFSFGINFLVYIGFILFYIFIILFFNSIIRNFSDNFGLSKLFYFFIILILGAVSLIITLI